MSFNNLFQVAFQIEDNCMLLGAEFVAILNELWDVIIVVVPVLLVVLITIDFVKAIMAGDEKQIKDAQSSAIKRIIIGVIIYFLPLLINLLLHAAGIMSGTCGIG